MCWFIDKSKVLEEEKRQHIETLKKEIRELEHLIKTYPSNSFDRELSNLGYMTAHDQLKLKLKMKVLELKKIIKTK